MKNNLRVPIIAAAAAVIASVFAFAAEPPLTLERCMELSEQNSSELRVQAEKLNQARQSYRQAWGGVLPVISYEASKLYRDTVDGKYSNGLEDSRFTLSQPLFRGFRTASGISYSKVQLQMEEARYRTAHRLLEAELTSAFYAYAATEADIANIQITVKIMNERLSELNGRVRLGKSRESEVLVVESQLATLDAQLQRAEGERANAAETLSYLTGLDQSRISITGGTSDTAGIMPVAEYLKQAKGRSDLEAARLDARSQGDSLRAAKGAFLPSVGVDGSWYTARSGSSSDIKWETLLWLQWPLFTGGTRYAGMKAEASRLKEYETRIELLERGVSMEISKLYRSLEASLKQAAAYRRAYEKAEKSYQIQLKDYRYGLVNNLEVIQMMTAMLDAKRNLDRALIQVKSDRALLEIAVKK